MKELSTEQMAQIHGGGCTFFSDVAVGAAAGAAGAVIGLASGGLGFVVGFAIGAIYSYGCHTLARNYKY